MKEWIKEQQRRYLDEPRLKELTEVMKQTRVLVRKKEYRKLSELVRQYRKSEDVITQVSCLLSASYLFPTPEKNGGNGQVGTDGGIERYLFHGEERFPAYGYQT